MGLALNETDIQFRNQHTVSTAVTTNVQPHANEKKSPAPPQSRFPYKIHAEKYVFKRGMEKAVAKKDRQGRHGKGKCTCQNARKGDPCRRDRGKEFG